MNPALIPDRLEELVQLIREEDLSRLTRRLLDLTADLSLPDTFRHRAIVLRARYNAFAAREMQDQGPEEAEAMLDQAETLVREADALLFGDAANPAAPQAPQAAPPQRSVFIGKGIQKSFQNKHFRFDLPTLNLTLKLGEISGVVGENGNGKTTLLRIVAGDLAADNGSLRYPDFELEKENWYQIKQHISFIPQHLKPWQGYLKENLHFTAAIHGIRGAQNEARVDFVIHRLGLSQYEGATWGEISSGYKLRFELARALVRYPRLLIIDEPLANLDINTQDIFLQDLRYLADSSRHPVSILISSQHLHEVESIADNILFIKNGEALYNGRMQDFGADRTENLFELGTSLSKSEVEKRLPSLEGIHIEDVGRALVIHTPLALAGNQLLAELVKAGVSVDYFRDISTSTLKLFREQP